MTKEENGYVDSRSLQYFSTEPTLDQVSQQQHRAFLSLFALLLARSFVRSRTHMDMDGLGVGTGPCNPATVGSFYRAVRPGQVPTPHPGTTGE